MKLIYWLFLLGVYSSSYAQGFGGLLDGIKKQIKESEQSLTQLPKAPSVTTPGPAVDTNSGVVADSEVTANIPERVKWKFRGFDEKLTKAEEGMKSPDPVLRLEAEGFMDRYNYTSEVMNIHQRHRDERLSKTLLIDLLADYYKSYKSLGRKDFFNTITESYQPENANLQVQKLFGQDALDVFLDGCSSFASSRQIVEMNDALKVLGAKYPKNKGVRFIASDLDELMFQNFYGPKLRGGGNHFSSEKDRRVAYLDQKFDRNIIPTSGHRYLYSTIAHAFGKDTEENLVHFGSKLTADEVWGCVTNEPRKKYTFTRRGDVLDHERSGLVLRIENPSRKVEVAEQEKRRVAAISEFRTNLSKFAKEIAGQ